MRTRRKVVTPRSSNKALAPPSAPGFTHIWDGDREQLPISDEMAAALVMLGAIRYSPEDGPNARVYRPRKNWTKDNVCTLEKIKTNLLGLRADAEFKLTDRWWEDGSKKRLQVAA